MKKMIDEEKRKKRKKKKISFGMMIFVVLIILSLLYLITLISTFYQKPYETRTAMETIVSDSVVANGVVVRDENLILENEIGDGVYSYNIKDGLRVPKNTQVAQKYSSTIMYNNSKYIEALDNQIKNLEKANETSSLSKIDINEISNDLQEEYIELLKKLTIDDYYNFNNSVDDLLFSVNKLNIALNNNVNYNDLISLLTTQKEEIVSQTVAIENITTTNSGYYLSMVDNLESVYTFDYVNSLSVDELYNLSLQENIINTNTAGKIISDYKWYYVCAVPSETIDKFKEAKNKIKVDIKFSNLTTVPAFIQEVEEIENSKYSKVVLRCEIMGSEIANLRFEKAEVSFETIRGIRVEKDAINIVNGQMGLFIKHGHIIKFKKINPIFEEETYVLLPLTTDESNEIQVFDEIIIKGKDLYDGKLL